jgi:hypothetical protein
VETPKEELETYAPDEGELEPVSLIAIEGE